MMQLVAEEKMKEGLPLGDEVHTIEKILSEEIKCIIKRNQKEKFLRSLLTRAMILEELNK